MPRLVLTGVLERAAFRVILVLGLATVAGCQDVAVAPVKKEVRFAMIEGATGLRTALIDVWNQRLSGVVFSKTTTPAGSAVDYIEKGQADIALVPSNIAYQAFTSGTEGSPGPRTKLRGIAMLYTVVLHLILAPKVPYDSVEDLRGMRVGLPERGSNTDLTVRTVLPHLGIPLTEVHIEYFPTAELTMGKLLDGTLQGAFIMNRYPIPLAKEILDNNPELRLAPIRGPAVTKLRESYPLLRPVLIPRDVYGEEVETLGSNWLLVCREDLSDDVVYQMLSIFVDSIQELIAAEPALSTVSLDDWAGTSIPLHRGAARFYRDRELLR